MLGRAHEAASRLEAADADSDPVFLPGLAGTLWRWGVAYLHMGREGAAVEQFKRAKEIDPNGLYGRLAAAALHQHSVWS